MRKANTESARSRKVKRAKAVGRTEDSFDDSMMTIGQILESTFPKPLPKVEKDEPLEEHQPIKIGKKEMSYRLAETFIKYIRKEEFLDSIKEYLREYNTNIEDFTKVCEKQGL